MPAPRLPGRIRTPEDILEFFGYLHRVDQTSFHPDDRFLAADGVTVNYVDAEGKPSYTVLEARRLDRLMGQAFEVASREGMDIYELALWATAEKPPVWPNWARKVIRKWSRKYWDPME